jgi:hypothetical protein
VRLIDADALRDELHIEFTAWGYTVPENEPSGGGTALNIIDRVLDAAPAVCCGECKYELGYAPEAYHNDKCWRCWGASNFERRTP